MLLNDVRGSVFQAVADISISTGRAAHTDVVSQLTGISSTKCGEYLRRLTEDDLLIRETRGYYRPKKLFPESRAVSTTTTPYGLVKLEIGDFVIDLTPCEAAQVGVQFAGFAFRLALSHS